MDFPVEGLDLSPHVSKKFSGSENLTNGGISQASSPVNGCFGLSSWKHRASFKKRLGTNNGRLNSSIGFSPNHEDNYIYDLYAVCNHHGKDVLGGHYTGTQRNRK